MGDGYCLPAGSCLRAASQKLHGAAAAARSGTAAPLAASVSAAAHGALTFGETGDVALMSPFDVTFKRVASGCREASAQPLARHMSLEPAGCSRECIKTGWRSLSFGNPGTFTPNSPRHYTEMQRNGQQAIKVLHCSMTQHGRNLVDRGCCNGSPPCDLGAAHCLNLLIGIPQKWVKVLVIISGVLPGVLAHALHEGLGAEEF